LPQSWIRSHQKTVAAGALVFFGVITLAVIGRREAPTALPPQVGRGEVLLRRTIAAEALGLPGGKLHTVVTRVRLGPRASLPPHRHAHPRYVFVLSGNVVVTEVATGGSDFYETGRVISDRLASTHEARNLQVQPAELLVFDLVPSDRQAFEPAP
jgi:quercetin dioxygenase-like cupin family protein